MSYSIVYSSKTGNTGLLAQTLRERGMPLPEGILTVSDMVKELKNVLCPSK